MAVKTYTSANDTAVFIKRMKEIRDEEYEARKRRLEGKGINKMTVAVGPGKQIGYSFKSGQSAAIASKYGNRIDAPMQSGYDKK